MEKQIFSECVQDLRRRWAGTDAQLQEALKSAGYHVSGKSIRNYAHAKSAPPRAEEREHFVELMTQVVEGGSVEGERPAGGHPEASPDAAIVILGADGRVWMEGFMRIEMRVVHQVVMQAGAADMVKADMETKAETN